MPRSIWSGSIAFGLVNVPVRVYPAIKEHTLHFHLVHEPDGGQIGYQKVCKAEDKPVPDDEIVKAFERKKGEYVYLSDEDFEQAQVEGQRTIDITDFVPYDDIDPIYFAKSYYLGPDAGAEHVYTLLVRALGDSRLAAIVKFVMRQRQHVGAIRVREDVLTMEQLHFADEIRPVGEIRATGQRIAKNELALARQIVESGVTAWKPEKYKDTYRAELSKAIEARRKGKGVHRAADVEEAEPIDLFEALRQSVEQTKRKRTTRSATRRRKSRAA